MSKHTPGPWVIRYKDAVYAQSERFIADCELTPYDARPQPPNSTDAANARLIAAAPELLEALRDALTVIEQDMSIVERNKKRDKVIAAINKAEGREG